MTEPEPPNDLAAGDLPAGEMKKVDLELQEEQQRLKWKTAVLFGGATVIVIFYAAGLAAIWYLMWVACDVKYYHLVLVGILFAVPTLVALNFFKLVGKSPGMTPEDFDNHPLVRLVREIIATFSGKD